MLALLAASVVTARHASTVYKDLWPALDAVAAVCECVKHLHHCCLF